MTVKKPNGMLMIYKYVPAIVLVLSIFAMGCFWYFQTGAHTREIAELKTEIGELRDAQNETNTQIAVLIDRQQETKESLLYIEMMLYNNLGDGGL